MLRRQASQHIRGRRGAHGDQCLSEPPPLLGCAEEGLLKGLQCDDLRVHEDLAQRALHDSYSSRVSGSVCLDRATTDRGRPRDDGRGVGRRFTRGPLDGADQVDRITDGAIPLSLPSYKGTAAIGLKCLEMSVGHAERRGSCHRSIAMSTSVLLKSTRPLGVR